MSRKQEEEEEEEEHRNNLQVQKRLLENKASGLGFPYTLAQNRSENFNKMTDYNSEGFLKKSKDNTKLANDMIQKKIALMKHNEILFKKGIEHINSTCNTLESYMRSYKKLVLAENLIQGQQHATIKKIQKEHRKNNNIVRKDYLGNRKNVIQAKVRRGKSTRGSKS